MKVPKLELSVMSLADMMQCALLIFELLISICDTAALSFLPIYTFPSTVALSKRAGILSLSSSKMEFWSLRETVASESWLKE